MSDERDELADILMSDAVNDSDHYGRDYALAEADAILAAGYRKPRQVTTVEEVAALPAGSMILDSDPDALLKTESGGWYSVHDGDHIPYPSSSITLPATVLHIGATT